jgi:hypothetical protein
MRLTLGNLQALQRLAVRADASTIDVREDGPELRVRYWTSSAGRRGSKLHEVAVSRRDSRVTTRG